MSPRGNDASVLTSVSPHNAPSMPLTMPRSTAQMTGCSIATSPNGQWLLTIRSWLLRWSAWAANPCAGERVGHGLHRRAQTALTGGNIGARQTGGHCLAVLLTDLLGHRLGLIAGQQRQGLAEQRQHEIVAAHRHVDRHVGHRSIALRRAAGAGTLGTLDGDLEVAAGGEPVEVMTGDVGVQAELLGDLRGGDAVRARGRTGRCRDGWGRRTRW